jgi:hypothetical protein
MIDGYITYTQGSGGTWIAWHTQTEPPESGTGRDVMSCPGPINFAIGPTSEAALTKLRADLSIELTPRRRT